MFISLFDYVIKINKETKNVVEKIDKNLCPHILMRIEFMNQRAMTKLLMALFFKNKRRIRTRNTSFKTNILLIRVVGN